MNRDSAPSPWLLWFVTAWPWVLTALLVASLVMLALFGSRLDDRLETIEAQVAHEMPPPYALPDLSDHRAPAVDAAALPAGGLVYVPAHSHVYLDGGRPFLLEATLSIRNTDPARPVYVGAVTYHDTRGAVARTFLDELIRLAPLETVDFVVEQHDTEGGSGANFLVQWHAEAGVAAPLIEAVMAGAVGPQAMGFVREGRPLPAAGR